jgi:hypothetical protein
MLSEKRRLALVLIDLAYQGRDRCSLGFGKYPLGIREAIKHLYPLVPADDPALPDLDKAISAFDLRLAE